MKFVATEQSCGQTIPVQSELHTASHRFWLRHLRGIATGQVLDVEKLYGGCQTPETAYTGLTCWMIWRCLC